jgi:hypothetical protein
MDLFEGVGLVVLLALSFRIVASFVAGIVTVIQQSGFSKDEIGDDLVWFGSFSEFTGIVLPLGLLAFLWWRVGRWVDLIDEVEDEQDSDDFLNDAKQHISALRWECAWVRWILIVTVIGAFIVVVSQFLYLPSVGSVWKQLMVNTTFQIAYVVILVGGSVLAYRLRETCGLALSDDIDFEP